MIKIEFLVKADNIDKICGVKVSGHSGYADEGSDIVCSAVSSALIMSINTITDIVCAKAYVESNVGRAELILDDDNPQDKILICDKILLGLRIHFLEMEKQYSEFMNVKNTEV